MGKGRLYPFYLMRPGPVLKLEKSLSDTDESRNRKRISAKDSARWVDRQITVDFRDP